MSAEFLSEDFLLQTDTARRLYHEHAEKMPIYDYHCHLPAAMIAADSTFENLTQAWLYGDHYKWRAMRTNGVRERYITGEADDYEKFERWAETVPFTLRNPLYHWTHLELKRYFGVSGKLLGPDTAREIYDLCSEKLRSAEFSVRNLLRKMNVRLVCTTDDPLDTLQSHKKVRQDGFKIAMHTAFRPDAAMSLEDADKFNDWLYRLEQAANTEIKNFAGFLEAVRKRHDYFHENGCRLSDHALVAPVAEEYTEGEIERIFAAVRAGKGQAPIDIAKFKSAMMLEFGRMNNEKGWVMQLHIGALRNVNSRMYEKLGADTGFDTIADEPVAGPLARFLDRLERTHSLPKTILYNLNPRDNAVLAALIGCFQDGSCAGKMQHGSGWWFLDQKHGIEQQLATLSDMGLLSRFVGMLTDSRSFLSFPRHEYFRRILCNILGSEVEAGLLPADMELLGRTVEDICFNNAKNYFPMQLD